LRTAILEIVEHPSPDPEKAKPDQYWTYCRASGVPCDL
jgi:hypothetical protein